MTLSLRIAVVADIPSLERLILQSVRGLAPGYYSPVQIERSIKTVFGVDVELITDKTYFVAESVDGVIAGCGGWGKRKTLYGASNYKNSRDSEMLDPRTEPAKIRAFFVHPDRVRKGIGRAILQKCELEAKTGGFRSAEMMATLPGVDFYKRCGYIGDTRVSISLGEGVSIDCIAMQKQL